MKNKQKQIARLASLRRAPTQARGGDRVIGILRACERCLANTTFDRLTLEEIAYEAGVQVGSVYFFFRDKTSIYCGLIETLLRDIMAEYVLAQRNLAKPFDEYLAALYARLARVWKRYRPLRDIWLAYRSHSHVMAVLHELWRVADHEIGRKLQADFPRLTQSRLSVVARVINASIAASLDSAALLNESKGRSFRKESLFMLGAYTRSFSVVSDTRTRSDRSTRAKLEIKQRQSS